LQEAMHRHSIGEIGEEHFWFLYRMITGRAVLPGESLLGKFFHPKINETVLQVLAELKASGIRTICATNVIDAHYRIHHKLNQYAVFDRVYASHLMGVAKPDPAFFSYILGAERINASEAFFTDDTAVNVDAARNAGLNAFVFTDAASLRKQLQLFGLPDKGEPGKL
ncbi:MAG: HAD-IA family hydrolase, partial [Treponema sp.]|nr:HAD-IA family hydrolase [Treponema sp.]